MLETFKIVLLSTIVITLWTALLLLQDKRGIPQLNRWFAVFLFALTTPQMDLYASHVTQGGLFLLSVIANTFIWLKGPFIWMFLAVLTRKNVSLQKIGIHFVPWLIAVLIILVDPQLARPIVILGMCQALAYLCAAIWRLMKKRSYIAEVWQGFQNTAYYWLLCIIGGLIILVAIDLVVLLFVQLSILKTYNLLDYGAFPIFSIYVMSIGILCVYRPELLFRGSSELNHTDAVPSNDWKETSSDQKTRYLELDVTAAQILTVELTKLMHDKELYRQNELSLPDLAQSLGISVHQLSELLNVHLGQNFYEFINGYRLKLACSLLKDPKCQLRVLDIAFESGFNNKNSFYRAFKEGLGITPNQFREGFTQQDVNAFTTLK